jgi:hypothetical protein
MTLAEITSAVKERDELRGIVLDLFAPEHFQGCLWRDDKRMPCQCGYYERRKRFDAARDKARAIAAVHYKIDLSETV